MFVQDFRYITSLTLHWKFKSAFKLTLVSPQPTLTVYLNFWHSSFQVFFVESTVVHTVEQKIVDQNPFWPKSRIGDKWTKPKKDASTTNKTVSVSPLRTWPTITRKKSSVSPPLHRPTYVLRELKYQQTIMNRSPRPTHICVRCNITLKLIDSYTAVAGNIRVLFFRCPICRNITRVEQKQRVASLWKTN